MKVVFVSRSVSHFPYYETIIRELHAHGHRVYLLLDREWSGKSSFSVVRNCEKELPNLKTGWTIRREGWVRSWLFGARELRSYASYVSRPDQSPFYLKRWQSYLSPPLRMAMRYQIIRLLVGSVVARKLFEMIEGIIPAYRPIVEWLRTAAPDIVVVTPANMRFSEEIEYIKAAKKIGIPTVVPVLSWDNLTTKGIFHVKPDLTMTWNQWQREEAVAIHHIPRESVAITGSPFFDKWFENRVPSVSRDIFLPHVGLDPSKPFLLYLGSSKNIAKDETWLVEQLHSDLRSHQNSTLRGLQILVRPHPANAQIYKRLSLDGLVVWPKQGALPDSEESKSDFECSMRYCIAAVGINTTGMIDSVIANRPTITIITDRYKDTQTLAVHFKYLREFEVLDECHGVGDCVSRLADLINGLDPKVEHRKRFVEAFVRPFGLNHAAGAVAADAIEALVVQRSTRSIRGEGGDVQSLENVGGGAV